MLGGMSRLSTGFVTMAMCDDVISDVGFRIRDDSSKKTVVKITRPSDRVNVSLRLCVQMATAGVRKL